MNDRVRDLLSRNYDDQRTPEWFAQRGTMLTASDVASAIGDNFFKSPDALLVEKCGFKQFKGNANTERGTILEPLVRDLYDETTNRMTHEIGLLVHEKYPWLGGSVDGITEDNLLIEIKCPNQIKKSIPKHYVPQIQVLLEITDLEECDFIQYHEGKMTIIRTKRDREWFAEKLPIMKAFWDRVIKTRREGLCEIRYPNTEAKPLIPPPLLSDPKAPPLPTPLLSDPKAPPLIPPPLLSDPTAPPLPLLSDPKAPPLIPPPLLSDPKAPPLPLPFTSPPPEPEPQPVSEATCSIESEPSGS